MQNTSPAQVPLWGRFECRLTGAVAYANPIQEASLHVTFVSPTGRAHAVPGFWDGGVDWRIRYIPDEPGHWTYVTACSDQTNKGLQAQSGEIECGPAVEGSRFDRHGPVRLSDNRRYFVHADGTPFFWLSDTAWNVALRATDEEWDHYLRERARQGFTAAQWVATQWFVSPGGDEAGQLAFTGHDRIAVNPTFFRRLDDRLDRLNRAGLLGVPVMLWAAEWSDPVVNAANPGLALPEDQAILLARYMVARWHAHAVAWILNGDGDYGGPKAERWKRIGRGIFGDGPHAPVSLHPRGMRTFADKFRMEPWLDLLGYQSGHGDSPETLHWLVAGPPALEWEHEPPRPLINLEPPYENHIAYHSKKPHTPKSVRRALYWSLLVAPTAGVSYGGHGVWGWDDGSGPPAEHPSTGTPLPWREALQMPAAEQVRHLAGFFKSIEWWRLRPAPELLAAQPGEADPSRHIAVSRADSGDRIVVYVPEDRAVVLRAEKLPAEFLAQWFDPRTGERLSAEWTADEGTCRFTTPAPDDWVLLLQAQKPIEIGAQGPSAGRLRGRTPASVPSTEVDGRRWGSVPQARL